MRDVLGKARMAVAGEDQAPRNALLLDQGAPVGRLALEALGVEHGPARGVAHEQREQDGRHPEQLGDLAVQTSPPCRARSSRAWSDTISSSASSTRLAT